MDVVEVARRLGLAGCVAAGEEAELLVVAAGGDAVVLEGLVARREGGEPLAWVTGSVRFGGVDVVVGAGVYVPRPQSEGLVRRAGARVPAGGLVVDVCCGAGAVGAAVTAARPDAVVVGVDIDAIAVAWARRNGVAALVGDGLEALRTGVADMVVAVAPYVPTGALALLPPDVREHEPRQALDGGGDGLDVVACVVAGAARVLRPGGWVLVEVGGDQAEAVVRLLRGHGFGAVATWVDDEGDLRGALARRGALP